MKKFGGTICFKSVPFPQENHGTTFTYTFKLESKESFELLQAQEQQLLGAYSLNSNILAFDYEIKEDQVGSLVVPIKEVLDITSSRLSEIIDEPFCIVSPSLTPNLAFQMKRYNELGAMHDIKI